MKSEDEKRELIELLPRMHSKFYSQVFKDDLVEFYNKIDLWDIRMENGDNFLHTLLR